ncbi:MAG: polysaccharide biosynthesis C-terminal domain-containing protein, partial [Chloroflexia bacterium]
PASMVLRGAGRVKALALAVMGEYAANIALSLLLLPRIGVIGAAIGTLIPALLVDGIAIPMLACRALGTDFADFARRSFVGPLLALIPTVLLMWPVARWLAAPTLANLLISGALVVLLFGASYLVIGASSQERADLGRQLNDLLKRTREKRAHR